MEGTMQMMTSAVLRRIEATSQSDAFATRFGSGSLGGQHALHAALMQFLKFWLQDAVTINLAVYALSLAAGILGQSVRCLGRVTA